MANLTLGPSARKALAHLISYLPHGVLWSRGKDTVLRRVLGVAALELGRVRDRIDDLEHEADPYRTTEMIADWEADVGLPDKCSGIAETLPERRVRVVQKLLARGGASPGYFIRLAEVMGYPSTTITEFKPFTCQSACDAPLLGPQWKFVWRVNILARRIRGFFNAQSPCNAPLQWWTSTPIECVFRRSKPAHTIVQFNYIGED